MSSVFDLDEAVRDEPAVADATHRYAYVVLVLAVLVALLTLATWLAVRGSTPEDGARPRAIGASVSMAIAEVVETADPEAVEHAAVDSPAPGTVEVCGFGRVAVEALESDRGRPAWLAAPLRDGERRTIERLVTSADERGRAVGQILRAMSVGVDDARAHYEALERDGIDCATRRCDAAAVSAPDMAARDALMRLAVGTRDPWVYGLAYHACRDPSLLGATPGCQMVSVERWTQLEPDNAIPWLHAASEAKQRGDAAAVDESIYRASQARTSDARFAQVATVARGGQPSGLAPAVALFLDLKALQIEGAFGFAAYGAAMDRCAKGALDDPNRRAVCSGLADVLVERSRSMLDLGLGLAIGQHLGWPSERIAAIEELRDAIYGSAAEAHWLAAEGALRLDCEAVRGQREYLAKVAELGERGAFAERFTRASTPRAEFAARHRKAMVELQRKAGSQAAPSSAGAASAPDGILRTASPTP